MITKANWYTGAMAYYSARRRNEVLICARKRMNLENVMVTERSQLQRTTCHMNSFTENVQDGTSTGTGGRLVAAWAGVGVWRWGV